MTKHIFELISLAWSKLYIAKLLVEVFDHPGFQESISFQLSSAQDVLEVVMQDYSQETFNDGGGI